jgi:hypothetical protein
LIGFGRERLFYFTFLWRFACGFWLTDWVVLSGTGTVIVNMSGRGYDRIGFARFSLSPWINMVWVGKLRDTALLGVALFAVTGVH